VVPGGFFYAGGNMAGGEDIDKHLMLVYYTHRRPL